MPASPSTNDRPPRPNNTPESDAPETPQDKLYDFTIRAGSKALHGIESAVASASLVGDSAFFDPHGHPEHFFWTHRLEDHWQTIRRELDQVLEHREQLPNFQDISTDQKHLTQDDDWKTFFLYGFGYKAEKNCARCPETTRLVESVPGMKTAFFSILAPGKHIPEHRGPYKGVLRYHLGLKVPAPAEQCRIRVEDETRHWEEGQSLMFDDTYRHEVWNDTGGERAILFMDVERPLAFPASLINRAIIALVGLSPFVQDARRNQKRWAERLEQKADSAQPSALSASTPKADR